MSYDPNAIEAAAAQTLDDLIKKPGDVPVITRAQLDAMSPSQVMATMNDVRAGKAELVD
jgi:hypothetical protein